MVNYLQPDYADLPGRRPLPRLYKRHAEGNPHLDVSVLTPFFNTEDFFTETAVALQAQSLQNWEWVIVDDGSTDQASLDRLDAVAQSDPRIRVIRQVNAGPGAARNTCFQNSTGRYVCLLDSDDMFEPTYLEKCVWFLDSNPEFAFCNAHSVVFGEQEYLWSTGFERGKAHVQANSGPPISVIRRAAYDDCGGFDESIRFGHEDWDFWLRMAKAGHWGYTLREFLQWYRKRGNGRFEQIMRANDVNANFEAAMRQKYQGLEQVFPEPVRRHPSPFESVDLLPLASNRLAANATGRRIMLLVPWMVTGGADRVNLDLVAGLTAQGHDVTVCATLSADHNWEHQFTQLTPDVFVLPNFLHPTDVPRFLVYLMASRQMDTVLVTGSTMGYMLLPYLRAAAPHVAFLDMCHVEEPHWLNGGHPRFGVGYQEALDLNIVTTGHLADWMVGRGGDAERIRVMYTGVNAPVRLDAEADRKRIREGLGIDTSVPLIVFVGRICAQKRPALLASILHSLRMEGREFRAVVMGDGELRAEFEAALADYDLTGRVSVLGSVPHQRWIEVLSAADIFLMPSAYEGISVALLEAMASGVVPVVAKVGGQEEVVRADAGFLIPHGEQELAQYTSALGQLLTDKALLGAMSAQCKVFSAANFSRQATVSKLLALFAEAHRLHTDKPRNTVGLGLARELATLALEYSRLGMAVDWLWNARDRPAAGAAAEPAPLHGLVRLWTAVGATRLGGALLGSAWLRQFAKWLLRRLESPARAER
jgi:glycosyltransferase involved in cell wall biosynthesis/GT2 family glycosyltransferase